MDQGVAEADVELVDDRGAPEELAGSGGQPGEHLTAQVVAHVAVGADRGDHRHASVAVARGQGHEVQPDGPALAPGHDVARLVLGERDAHPCEEVAALVVTERQVVGLHLDQPSFGACAGDPLGQRSAAEQRQLRTRGDPGGHGPEHLVAVGLGEEVDVVDHQHEGARWLARKEGQCGQGDRREPRLGAGEHPAGVLDVGSQRLQRVDEREGERCRVVHEPGDPHGGVRPSVVLGPLRGQGGLAEPGPGGDDDERPRRVVGQARQQQLPLDADGVGRRRSGSAFGHVVIVRRQQHACVALQGAPGDGLSAPCCRCPASSSRGRSSR